MDRNSSGPDRRERLEQIKLIYDYVKFHIGLYIGTPAALAVLADAFDVKKHPAFGVGLVITIVIYVPAGVHAALFMSRNINTQWGEGFLEKFEAQAFAPLRRTMHHKLYWAGLISGMLGLTIAVLQKQFG